MATSHIYSELISRQQPLHAGELRFQVGGVSGRVVISSGKVYLLDCQRNYELSSSGDARRAVQALMALVPGFELRTDGLPHDDSVCDSVRRWVGLTRSRGHGPSVNSEFIGHSKGGVCVGRHFQESIA